MKIINLNSNFSTSSRLFTQPPIVENSESCKVKKMLFLPLNSERKAEGGLRTKGYFKYNQYNSNFVQSNQNSLNYPLVTIITVVFNRVKYLEKTIQSVINQTYNNIEYIIIDGGSSDGTVDIIRKYDNLINYWVSEPDRGLYDAMNKGIQLGSGEIIGIINSDDWYLQDAISKVVDQYIANKNVQIIIWGSMYRVDEDGNTKFKINKSEKYFKTKINLTNPINHPATFVAKNVYEIIGLFDNQYKICSDYDLIYKAYYCPEITFVQIDDCLACMRLGGISEQSNLKTIWTIAKESYNIRKTNTLWIKNIITFIYSLFRFISKRWIKHLLNESIMSFYYRYRHKV